MAKVGLWEGKKVINFEPRNRNRRFGTRFKANAIFFCSQNLGDGGGDTNFHYKTGSLLRRRMATAPPHPHPPLLLMEETKCFIFPHRQKITILGGSYENRSRTSILCTVFYFVSENIKQFLGNGCVFLRYVDALRHG